MKTHFLFILAFSFLIGFSQCKSDKPDTSESSQELLVSDSLSNIVFLLPSPDEILNEIFFEEVELNPAFISPITNSEKYLDTRYQALNLGVYIADFAYLSFTDNKNKEIEYLKVIRDLSEKVNLYGLMDENLLNRIQANLTNNDTLQTISQEMYYNLSDMLENTNRSNIFTLISTGTIVEALYLASMNVTNYKEFEEVIKRMFEQKFVFENFYEFAMQYSTDEYVKSILSHLDQLKQMFEDLQKSKTETKVTKTEGNNFRIEGGIEFIVNEQVFQNFKINIIKIREEIINVSNK
ncbi:MAG: hypothetical protein A2W99_02995 [Bacteroidetes bacterium GWF2_33_16]|nr:MAG: hypothetical protein A2X00_10020 [Bacteroidetes bacterium GWE2_32_14]OFY07861.1 MAG: hypothetical protein A2W99_02995 [Bacteroidetes bacterium GWF2_33_16]